MHISIRDIITKIHNYVIMLYKQDINITMYDHNSQIHFAIVNLIMYTNSSVGGTRNGTA